MGYQTVTHYVLYNGATVMVKEASFFIEQGGLQDEWGKKWRPVKAPCIGGARREGAKLFAVTLTHIYADECDNCPCGHRRIPP